MSLYFQGSTQNTHCKCTLNLKEDWWTSTNPYVCLDWSRMDSEFMNYWGSPHHRCSWQCLAEERRIGVACRLFICMWRRTYHAVGNACDVANSYSKYQRSEYWNREAFFARRLCELSAEREFHTNNINDVKFFFYSRDTCQSGHSNIQQSKVS